MTTHTPEYHAICPPRCLRCRRILTTQGTGLSWHRSSDGLLGFPTCIDCGEEIFQSPETGKELDKLERVARAWIAMDELLQRHKASGDNEQEGQ